MQHIPQGGTVIPHLQFKDIKNWIIQLGSVFLQKQGESQKWFLIFFTDYFYASPAPNWLGEVGQGRVLAAGHCVHPVFPACNSTIKMGA